MKVVAWNMAHKRKAWAALEGLEADVALLTEARVLAAGREENVLGGEETAGLDHFARPWATAIASPHPLKEVCDAQAVRYGRELNIPFEPSRRGSWTAAVVSAPVGDDVTAISLYGLLDEKSDASMHRSLSELAPIFDDKRYKKHLLLGGDFNTWTGWGAGSAHLARDRAVLERIRAYGLIDCLERVRPEGRLDDCPCSFGEKCTHTRTRVDPRKRDVPYQMDYLFASRALAERLVTCESLVESPWPKPSDHNPIVATFED